jgi:short-subunit dehydrogenase
MNKLMVVTGGTKGIGRAIVEIFAAAKFDIVTCARNGQDLHELKVRIASEYPDVIVTIIKADLSVKEQTMDFISGVKQLNRSIDILVNNTGAFIPGQVLTEDEGVLESMIETNLYSAYRITRGLISLMPKNNGSHIFTMCSTASFVPYVNGGSYCIAKYGMLGMTKVLREELKKDGIRVTAIMPGATYTASWEGTDLPEDRFMKSEDVAKMVFESYNLSSRSVVEEIIIRPQLGDL